MGIRPARSSSARIKRRASVSARTGGLWVRSCVFGKNAAAILETPPSIEEAVASIIAPRSEPLPIEAAIVHIADLLANASSWEAAASALFLHWMEGRGITRAFNEPIGLQSWIHIDQQADDMIQSILVE